MTEPRVFLDGKVTLFPGDCLVMLKEIPDGSVDAVVTDPPAGIAFMGREWDKDKGGRNDWIAWMSDVAAQCLRVIKPGGHALVWALPRTSHWTATAWEDAGWDVRDRCIHIFGSGFPKSMDISKQLDKAAGAEGGYGAKKPNVHSRGDHVLNEGWRRPWMDDAAAVDKSGREYLPSTEAARQWQGWGTALKPAAEDWWLLRKPLIGTVAQNVLTHGVGGLNVNGCRVEGIIDSGWSKTGSKASENVAMSGRNYAREPKPDATMGRYPANVTHDGSDEVLAGFPETGISTLGVRHPNGSMGYHGGASGLPGVVSGYVDSGSAARFFYCAKGSSDDRVGSKHPTVKNLDLMQWLIRLVTPRGGTVLDCFAGTGTTGETAWREGMKAILIEREPEYQADIARRMELAVQPTKRAAVAKTKNKLDNPNELPLFSTEKEKPL